MHIRWHPTRGFGRSPQQVDIAHNVSCRPLEHLSDETLRLLVENARLMEEGGSVLVDGDGQVVSDASSEQTASIWAGFAEFMAEDPGRRFVAGDLIYAYTRYSR